MFSREGQSFLDDAYRYHSVARIWLSIAPSKTKGNYTVGRSSVRNTSISMTPTMYRQLDFFGEDVFNRPQMSKQYGIGSQSSCPRTTRNMKQSLTC